MISSLPLNLYPIILANLSRDEIKLFSKSSKYIHQSISNTAFWRNLLLTRYGIINSKELEKEYHTKYNQDSLKLFEYIEQNNLVEFNKLLQRGVNINVRCKALTTPLIKASVSNKAAFVESLLRYPQIKVNVHSSIGTALSVAVLNKSLAMTKLLLAKGANPDVGVQLGSGVYLYTLAYSIEYKCDIEITRALLDGGAEVNPTKGRLPLFAALKLDDLELIKLLLKYGADPNYDNSYNLTSVFVIEKSPHKNEIIKLFLDNGLNISQDGLIRLGYSE